MKFKYNLGDIVRDRVTSFEGVITCRSQWLNNCNTYTVRPRTLDEKGMPKDGKGFDEPQLEFVESTDLVPPVDKPRTGGPERAVERPNR